MMSISRTLSSKGRDGEDQRDQVVGRCSVARKIHSASTFCLVLSRPFPKHIFHVFRLKQTLRPEIMLGPDDSRE